MAEKIDQAKETAIRNDERQRIAAEVQQLREERIGILADCSPTSSQRAFNQGNVNAYSAVLNLLGVRS